MTTAASRLLVLRVALGTLAFSALSVGVLASFAPRTFYDDFPLGAAWVSLLPPFSEHLVTDVGGFQLAFGALFAYAAWRPSRELVVPLCAGWLLSQMLHLTFHVTHLDGFSTADAVAQTVGLAAVVALPALAIALSRDDAGPRRGRGGCRRAPEDRRPSASERRAGRAGRRG